MVNFPSTSAIVKIPVSEETEANGNAFFVDPSFTIPLMRNCAWLARETKKNNKKKCFIDKIGGYRNSEFYKDNKKAGFRLACVFALGRDFTLVSIFYRKGSKFYAKFAAIFKISVCLIFYPCELCGCLFFFALKFF